MDRQIINEYMNMLEYDNFPEELYKYLMSPSLIRLKNVGYFCGMDYASKKVYNFSEKISRYDHSLTVALITWKLTRDIKSTLAGLFHDVATPCFSHVIDYMNKDYAKQESTEEKTEEIILNDKYLCDCLRMDNISVDEIIDFKRYSIVDSERPRLCADRLDGVILTGLFWTKSISLTDVYKIILDLDIIINEDGQKEIAFKSREIAELVKKTSELIDVYCHSKEDNYMMELLARITKRAIDLKIITYDELYLLDEETVFSRLKMIRDIEVVNDLKNFSEIDGSLIPDIEMPYIKVRELKPIGNGVRIK